MKMSAVENNDDKVRKELYTIYWQMSSAVTNAKWYKVYSESAIKMCVKSFGTKAN